VWHNYGKNARRHECPFTYVYVHTYCGAGGSVNRGIPNFGYMLFVCFIDLIVLSV